MKLSTKGLFILNLAEVLAYLKVLPVIGKQNHILCYDSDTISSGTISTCESLSLNEKCRSAV